MKKKKKQQLEPKCFFFSVAAVPVRALSTLHNPKAKILIPLILFYHLGQ